MKGFAARVTQASRTELVVIMYEIILADIKSAKIYYHNRDMAMFERELKHAQRFLHELMATLDYRYELSFHLMSLYVFANQAVITAIFQKKTKTLDEAESILYILLEGFKSISKKDSSGPVMQNTQQLYAGLTYGRGVLNEMYIDPNEQSRGFRA